MAEKENLEKVVARRLNSSLYKIYTSADLVENEMVHSNQVEMACDQTLDWISVRISAFFEVRQDGETYIEMEIFLKIMDNYRNELDYLDEDYSYNLVEPTSYFKYKSDLQKEEDWRVSMEAKEAPQKKKRAEIEYYRYVMFTTNIRFKKPRR